MFDISKDRTTQQVKDVIVANNCVYIIVPKNLITHIHQWDLNVNEQAKQFPKGAMSRPKVYCDNKLFSISFLIT